MGKCFVNYNALTQVKFIHPFHKPSLSACFCQALGECWEDGLLGESCGGVEATGRDPSSPGLSALRKGWSQLPFCETDGGAELLEKGSKRRKLPWGSGNP